MAAQLPSNRSLSHRIITGVIWNFLGQIWMLALAFFATPFIVRSLSVSLYGIYGLVSVIIGYFSFLQLGLGNASIKYISQYLASGEEEKIRKVFWSCLFSYLFLGLFGIVIISSLSGVMVQKFLRIPEEFKPLAISVLRLGSWGFLVSMLLGSVSSALAAAGRFDLLNRTGILLGTLQIASVVALLKLGFSLKAIVVSNVAVQSIGVYMYWAQAKMILPFLSRPCWSAKTLLGLLKFGGFVTVSTIINPILLNIEKLFLTSLQSIYNLTYYLIPFSLVDRLSMIRSSVSSVLFPAFSYFQQSDKDKISRDLHYRSTLFILLLYTFVIAMIACFARPFFALWIGADFAERSTRILIILGFAGFVNSMAGPSIVALQGMEKPHIPALFHVIELAFYVPLSFLLIRRYGGTGAAAAWCLRVAVDTLLLHKASCSLFGVSLFAWYRRLLYRGLTPLLVCAVLFPLLKRAGLPLLSAMNIIGILLIFALYAFSAWRWAFDDMSRQKLSAFIQGLFVR